MIIRIPNQTACIGFSIKSISTPGIAPINGPKTGIMFVIPTIVYINTLYGKPIIAMHMNVNTPIIN